VKLLAMKALASGLTHEEVAELVGVHEHTIGDWKKRHDKGGVDAFVHKPSTVAVRKRCAAIEARIVERRKTEPEAGVRRIRDELRREEGIEVSAETVRQVVNEAGLGNPPPEPHRRPPQVRRFERPVPNAMWQIDIFTFTLKRLFPVYLIGVIDDHSRYIVGWGLFRQQTAEAVLEVVKGAIGQWGAPREILSDNGRQFVNWRGKSRFQKVLAREGIDHSRSAPHHPMTLGKIERFWQTIWTEFLEEAVFASFADACLCIPTESITCSKVSRSPIPSPGDQKIPTPADHSFRRMPITPAGAKRRRAFLMPLWDTDVNDLPPNIMGGGALGSGAAA
ncbi:MAG: transposase, partial [Deltaproteobacteria bacterium]|nr:transposase [Deltaproteobacteria bacterium]